MKFIAKNHNKLVDFIKKSALSSIMESPEYKEVMKQIEDAKIAAKKEQDRNKRAAMKVQIDNLEKQIRRQMETSS